MIVYRICNTYPPDHDPIDGVGAFRKGGRWNEKGTYAIYTSSSLALARCELARHVNLESIPDDFRVYEIEVPEKGFIKLEALPHNWQDDPPSLDSQKVGSELLNKSKDFRSYCPLYLRSAIAANYILNPLCKDFQLVKSFVVIHLNYNSVN